MPGARLALAAAAPGVSEGCLQLRPASSVEAYTPAPPEVAVRREDQTAAGPPADVDCVSVGTVSEAKAGAASEARAGFCAEGQSGARGTPLPVEALAPNNEAVACVPLGSYVIGCCCEASAPGAVGSGSGGFRAEHAADMPPPESPTEGAPAVACGEAPEQASAAGGDPANAGAAAHAATVEVGGRSAVAAGSAERTENAAAAGRPEAAAGAPLEALPEAFVAKVAEAFPEASVAGAAGALPFAGRCAAGAVGVLPFAGRYAAGAAEAEAEA